MGPLREQAIVWAALFGAAGAMIAGAAVLLGVFLLVIAAAY